MAKEIRVPALGESVTEATIAKWFRQAGDAVNVDEPLVDRDELVEELLYAQVVDEELDLGDGLFHGRSSVRVWGFGPGGLVRGDGTGLG